jgi:hypothetical protein
MSCAAASMSLFLRMAQQAEDKVIYCKGHFFIVGI